MKDIHGQAILDFLEGERSAPLIIHNNYDTPEEMNVEVFFRDELDFTVIEHLALMQSTGEVLDVGAGAGAITLALQRKNLAVTALENSPGCITAMEIGGVKKCIQEDYKVHQGSYDTILVLMNGLGLAGKLKEVPHFLRQCMSLLNKGGQLLIDSSDIDYLYESGVAKPTGYYGEVRYRYEYKNQFGDWFDWVYVDPYTLQSITEELGLSMEVLHSDETAQYLARITAG